MLEPSTGLLLLILVVVTALVFDLINGFHDTANAVATVISTRVLPPTVAIMMAAFLNLIGAFLSTEVAGTIANKIVDTPLLTDSQINLQLVVLAGLLGAIIWQLFTWFFGIPSSSSHALIGGLCGAAIAASAKIKAVQWHNVFEDVIIPLVTSPVVGFMLGFVLMATIFTLLAHVRPFRVTAIFSKLQILTAGGMALAHGANDAQKSMGIIALALVAFHHADLKRQFTANSPGKTITADEIHLAAASDERSEIGGLPSFMFPREEVIKDPVTGKTKDKFRLPIWVITSCAVAMAVGTAMGGHRIIKTMGHKIIRLEPVHGSAAEASAAATIMAATYMGMPVSTTHVISGSIFGVGTAQRFGAVHWDVAYSMVVAWVLTLPAAGFTAAGAYLVMLTLGMG